MLKKILNFGILGLLILFIVQSSAYAMTDLDNPFTSYDNEYGERLKTAKDIPDNQVSLQSGLSNVELKRQESETLESSRKHYIVKFVEDSSMQQIFDIINLYDYEVLGRSDNRLFVLELNDIKGFQDQTKDIVEFIEEDMKKKVNFVPSDSYYAYQWALPATNVPEAWEISKGSDSVYVAVIDSGIYRNQPDLINADIRNGWDYIFDDNCDWDSNGHGTNVTGIIGAETNNSKGIAGVNWDVAIIPLRVLSSDGRGYVSDTIEAIYDAAYMGCDVINLSLGESAYSSAENLAVQYAISEGCIVVASAGNDGDSKFAYPASYEGVISVGSINSDFLVSDFSQHNNKIDVTAPGEGIFTTAYWIDDFYGNDYAFVDGTSFSAPYVSGIAALVSAVEPSITADEFMDLLKVTSTDLGYPGYDNYYGYGLINAEKMLKSVAEIHVKTVSLNKSSIILSISDSEKLIPTFLPSNATDQNVTWKSSNPSVATVKNGLVTAVDDGTAIITVTTQDGGKTATCVVNAGSKIWGEFEDVKLDKMWTIKFNMELDDTSWKENVHIFDTNGEEFPIIVSKIDDGKSLTVTPLKDYNYDSNYTMVIDNNIISETGVKLKDLVHVPFITRGRIIEKASPIEVTLIIGDKYTLPTTIPVYVEGTDKPVDMNVEWDSEVETSEAGEFTFNGALILPDGFINNNNVVAVAKITVQENPGPITVEQIPYEIEILKPNSIGTIYMQATYKNDTDYPITSFNMKLLLKDENKTTYLSNYDTVLPGETSPIFDTFGPESMKMSDIEVYTIDIRLETPNGKRIRVEYDAKLYKYEYSEYNSDYTDNAPITGDQLPYEIEILKPNSIGTIYMQATYKNNSDYPITSFNMKLLLKDENDTTYLSNYDTVLPGETSPIFDTFGPKSMNMNDIQVLIIDYRAETPSGKTIRVEYNTKLDKYDYNEY